MSANQVTVRVEAKRYEDHDDCLTAAAEDYSAKHGLLGWDLAPRWDDDDRTFIALYVPAFAVRGCTTDGGCDACRSEEE